MLRVCVSHKNSGLIRQGGENLKYDSDLTRIIKPLIAQMTECVCERVRQTDILRGKVFVGQSASKYFKRESMCRKSVLISEFVFWVSVCERERLADCSPQP